MCRYNNYVFPFGGFSLILPLAVARIFNEDTTLLLVCVIFDPTIPTFSYLFVFVIRGVWLLKALASYDLVNTFLHAHTWIALFVH